MLPRREFVALLCAAPFAFGEDSFDNVQRIVAIGDVHGDVDALLGLLHTAKLVDARDNWSGGKSHLVLPGDFLDRGKASRKVLDLLIELEPQARKAGGRVHALLGNHEAMNLYGDLRYNVKADWDAYRTGDSENLRNRMMQASLTEVRGPGRPPIDLPAYRKKFEDDHPLGWFEKQQAFSPEGKYGKWLHARNAIVKINDIVFVHGGISPKYSRMSIKAINDRIHSELDDPSKLDGGMTTDGNGPLWYRGLADQPESDREISDGVDEFLKDQGARHIVIGHTVGTAITPRFHGKVILIDVGISEYYSGPPAFLLVEDSKFYAVHRGRQLDLPVDGGSIEQYLRAAAALEPPNSRLRREVSKAGPTESAGRAEPAN